MFRAMEEIIYERQSSPVSDDKGSEDNIELLPAPFDGIGILVNWCKVRDSKPFILVELKPGQLEYEKISADFSREEIKVSKIQRLQNMNHLDRFKSEVEEIKKTYGNDLNPNIRYLYHGTCIEISRICEEGLDQRLSRTGQFGKDIYLSDSPIKCLYNSDFVNHPERAIILKCRIVLEDCKGCPKDFSEYVCENRQVMVEYIISFEVDEKMLKLVKPGPVVDSLSQEPQEKKSSGNAWKYVAAGLGVSVVGFIATPLIATAALGAVGFTSGGVAAGSIAAAIQASIGNVAAGSAFALAQSAGATGAVSVGTQVVGGTILGTAGAAVMKLFKGKPTEEKKSNKKE
ncbi:hypothetical protein CHS0354_003195 [Potamilus streckersoni]|uniref:PARP catalytic domain-containing protein n=1 Tax=Potamilus streckersoni TaxID=2493646 RepID=A0AAE0SIS0_9BIVA|nr:hypothetical protein CHS0354_003195 [Potamilus streckersoni]